MPKGSDDKWTWIMPDEALETREGPVVDDFPMQYRWHAGPWEAIFDLQIDLVKSDIRRARAEGKLIVYLSCPISSRGGGYHGTNVDIAKYTERALLQRWGEAFWLLNPVQYQLESKAGTGLMDRHAQELGIPLDQLRAITNPSGNDYLRMWTRVLVEDDEQVGVKNNHAAMRHTGQHVDAFYFLGPRDVQAFFLQEGVSLTAGLEAYFARRYATDQDFRDAYTVEGIVWGHKQPSQKQRQLREQWQRQRLDFFRYYGLRASANFSLGSHDEWNIFRLINQRRRAATKDTGMVDGNVSLQLAGFFDGGQLDPGSTEMGLSRGYEI